MVIDAHAHIFARVQGRVAAGPTHGLGYGRVSFGGAQIQALPPLAEATAFGAEMLLAHLDWAGVERAVLLQGPFYGECNQYVLEAVSRYPDRLVAAAYFDPWVPDNCTLYGRTLALGPFRALKLECSENAGLCGLHPDARLDDPGLEWLWSDLERRDMVLVVDLGAVGSRAYQTAAVRAIATHHPGLPIVIPHLAQPTPRVEADPGLWSQWLAQIDLGRLPNVWFDCAALPGYLPRENYPYPTAGHYLRLVIERIGAGKVMWGSDLPSLLTHATYRQLVEMAELHTQFLTRQERELVLGGNALRVYWSQGER